MTNHHLNSQVLQAITELSNQLTQTKERLTNRMDSMNKRVTANESKLSYISQKVNKYADKLDLISEELFEAQADIKMLKKPKYPLKLPRNRHKKYKASVSYTS